MTRGLFVAAVFFAGVAVGAFYVLGEWWRTLGDAS